MSMAARDLLWKYPDTHRFFVDLDEETRGQLESIAVAKNPSVSIRREPAAARWRNSMPSGLGPSARS